jgi:hypothetical protein
MNNRRDFEAVSFPWREVIPAFMETAVSVGLDEDKAATLCSELGRFALEDAITSPTFKAAIKRPARVEAYLEHTGGKHNGRPRVEG